MGRESDAEEVGIREHDSRIVKLAKKLRCFSEPEMESVLRRLTAESLNCVAGVVDELVVDDVELSLMQFVVLGVIAGESDWVPIRKYGCELIELVGRGVLEKRSDGGFDEWRITERGRAVWEHEKAKMCQQRDRLRSNLKGGVT